MRDDTDIFTFATLAICTLALPAILCPALLYFAAGLGTLETFVTYAMCGSLVGASVGAVRLLWSAFCAPIPRIFSEI